MPLRQGIAERGQAAMGRVVGLGPVSSTGTKSIA
jgi:hypothetical protein